MGALAEQAGDEPAPLTGYGRKLLAWWYAADDEDRALLRRWVEASKVEGGKSLPEIAERLTAAGYPICAGTVANGLRLLRRLPEWES